MLAGAFASQAIPAGTCFFQPVLQQGARDALADVLRDTAGCRFLFWGCRLRTAVSCITARLCAKTDVLGVVPKTTCPITMKFYEKRQFTPAPAENGVIDLSGAQVLFGTNLLFQCGTQPALTLAVEICEDLWAPFASHRGTPWQAPHLSAIFPPVTRPSARLNTAVRL